MRIKEVKEFKGESSVSVRKGKKIVTYDYQVRLLWKCDLADEGNTKVIGSCEGEFFFPEISNDVLDDGDEWECEVRTNNNSDENIKKICLQLYRDYAPKALKKQIKEKFVEELKKK